MRVLVTGATGFIGSVVCRHIAEAGAGVRATIRDGRPKREHGIDWFSVGNIDGNTDWHAALHDVDVVVHLAGQTHTPPSAGQSVVAQFRTLNVDGTRALTEQAMQAGIERFVYMSSIKVNGERSPLDHESQAHRFSGRDTPHPEDEYGRTKWEAENILHEIVAPAGAGLIILRPPLVYGPGQKANMLRLVRLVSMGVPLPLGAVSNSRSLIYVENLAEAVVCAALKTVNGGVFTLADVDIATPDLIRAIAAALGKPARLFPIPVGLLRSAAAMLGFHSVVDRLTGSLLVDSTEIRSRLGWEPSTAFDDAMAATAAWFQTRGDKH